MSDYATVADVKAMLDNNTLLQLTDDTGIGEVADLVIIEALTSAQAEVDATLQVRMQLPLADPPQLLRTLTLDLALGRLYMRRGLDTAEALQRRIDNANRILGQIRDGKLSIGQGDTRGVTAHAPVYHIVPDTRSRGIR